MAVALGIDLGTTYTVAAIIKDGQPVVLPNAEGQRLTPSVVAFPGNGRLLVGQPAKAQATSNPERTVFSIKRWMGSGHWVSISGHKYTPPEISGLILKKVKTDVERYLGEEVTQAVVTVPAYFNDLQRQATKQAGALAGLDIMRIINEPTAAALAYGIDQEEVHTVLVWDLGGGTFDVSVLELGQGIFEVRAVSGDSWLGGDDYDARLMSHLVKKLREQHGVDLSPRDASVWQSLREVAEQAKIELTTALTAQVVLPAPGVSAETAPPLEVTVTRDEFQELTADLIERMVTPTRQALADAGLEPGEIDRVVLVGGSTRMPAVQAKVKELIGKEPYRYVNPDEVVAVGAAVQAGVLLGQIKKVALLDVIPLSLGVETQGGLFARVIPRNTPVPAFETRVFTTAIDDQPAVDIHVLQGERDVALYNISLGWFQLQGLPRQPRGVPKIEVTFEADVDGVIHVSATDLRGDASVTVKLVSSKQLDQHEIVGIVQEAASSAEDDLTFRETTEAGIIARNLIIAAEELLAEPGARSGEVRAEQVEVAIMGAQEALAHGDLEEVNACIEKLRGLLRRMTDARTHSLVV